jgi:predicted nucleotidyltransferase
LAVFAQRVDALGSDTGHRYWANRSGAASLVLDQPQLDAIADACRHHQVLRMHLFGSSLRDDFDPTRSVLDLLVEFKQIESGSLVQAFFGLERQFASITGKPVDLVQADAVRKPYVRRDIEASNQLIYEA